MLQLCRACFHIVEQQVAYMKQGLMFQLSAISCSVSRPWIQEVPQTTAPMSFFINLSLTQCNFMSTSVDWQLGVATNSYSSTSDGNTTSISNHALVHIPYLAEQTLNHAKLSLLTFYYNFINMRPKHDLPAKLLNAPSKGVHNGFRTPHGVVNGAAWPVSLHQHECHLGTNGVFCQHTTA